MGKDERQERREKRRENLLKGEFRLDTNGNLFDHDKIGKEQKVDGIYWTSKTTRDSIMKHIWDRYNMLPDTLTYSMGKLMDAISIAEHSPKNMTSLYEYTHNGKTGFSQSISDKYLNAGKRENRLISIGSDYSSFIPWHEKYGMDPTSNIEDRKNDLKIARKSKKDNLKKLRKQGKDAKAEKDDEGVKSAKDARKKIRKEYRQKRNELEKDGIWTNNTDRDAIYNDYGKLNRSASWIENNLGEESGTIGNIIKNKYWGEIIDDSTDVNFGGSNNLTKWSVLNRRNGLVDIIAKQRHHSDSFSQKELKKCMFSITNLATRSAENPMGTVMWFPPYDLNFQESVSVGWDEKQFIGRGEPIYSYVNTKRDGTLSFTLLIDHPSILNDIARQRVGGGKTNDDIERDILKFFSGTGKEGIEIYTPEKIPNAEEPFIVNEYTYFEKLEENNKFIFDKIKEKVKYFHPAYHSMTPEGFNMRLNFLHQCTRQGPTVGSNGVASNSVFGRPPFCELRIGDFINTRIAINSLSITYDNGGGMTWDLNPEGIGVQPMMAKIQLGIHILGGQSLSGPVLELCNAVSHNFYANTGVYASSTDEKRMNIDNKFAEDRAFMYQTEKIRMENQIRFEKEKQKRLNEIESELYNIDEDIFDINDEISNIVYNELDDESYLNKTLEEMKNELEGVVDDELEDQSYVDNHIRPLRRLISLRKEEREINERKNNLIEERKLYNTQG